MMRVAVSLVLLLALAMPAAAQEPPAPAVAIDAKDLVYDAGTVKRGTRVTHTFVLRNAGGSPLSVDAKPG
jgi:opacity protein-like surface antigen